jgi:phosphoribosylglycinamide formyltransferase-1
VPTSKKAKLVILISGSGSNLQAFIDACAKASINAEIACVISNKAQAQGLQRAANAGLHTAFIDHNAYAQREDFDQALGDAIASFSPDLVILAGFMRILTPAFVNRFAGRIMNIHPSLLPKYPGLHTHQRAIDAGDKTAGATVHFVTPELDGGPAIIQAAVPITAGETAESLAAKILHYEHRIYPEAVNWFLQGRLQLHENYSYLDQQQLPITGIQFKH